MALNNDLISQFVKATKDDKKTSSEKTVYGTIVEYDGSKYLKIDGSDLLTPVSSTTNASNDDRVMAMIKNHTVTVTGNISSPSARTTEVEEIGTKISEFEIIIADKVDTIELNAERARIDELVAEDVKINNSLIANAADIKELEADNVTIKESLSAVSADIKELEAENATITGKLEANDADIESLQADNVTIKNDLTANKADITDLNADFASFKTTTTDKLAATDATIESLETTKLSAKDIEGKYANIDFSNIGEAAMEYLYSQSGLIENITISNGTITGNLIGVTIKGDLIEGGTVVADKLVVKGTDGLYYKLNTDGVKTETEQTDYNSLNGSIITANSITATKINVDDLVAFDATIGGFNITESAIYSGVKSSADNTTRGIYLDKEGQAVFGDASNYIKYYKDGNSYKLVISADSISFSSGTNVGTAIENAQSSADEAHNKIDDLEVGGRNLLLNSGEERSSTTYHVTTYTPSSPLVAGEEYTASVCLTPASGVTSIGLYLSSSYKKQCGIAVSETSRQIVSATFTAEYCDGRTPDDDELYANMQVYRLPNSDSITDTTIIHWIKVEKGNKATDWTPAPEELRDASSLAQATADANSNRISSAETTITQLVDSISTLVRGQNGESLMTQTDTGWTFSIADVLNTLDTAMTDISDLNSDVNNANHLIDVLNQNVIDLGEYKDYIHFGTDGGKPCIILGETDSVFRVLITNTDIRFMEGTATPASISNESLNIEKAVITEELRQGGFAWVARSNGNYGLLWKGE